MEQKETQSVNLKTQTKILPYHEFVVNTGKMIQSLRTRREYTRRYVAAMADITEKYLYEIEIGKKGCSCYILYRLARVLDVTMDDLVNDQLLSGRDFEEMMENIHGYRKEMLESIMENVYDGLQKIW